MLQLYADTADPGPADGLAGRGRRDAAGAAVPVPARAGAAAARRATPLDGYALATRLSLPADRARRPTTRCCAAAERASLDDRGRPARRRPIACWPTPRAAELFVHFATSGGSWAAGHARQGLASSTAPGQTRRRPRSPRRRGCSSTDAWQNGPTLTTLLTGARHVRRRRPGRVLRSARAGRRRVPARRPRSRARRRAADAGLVPGRARQGRPDVAGPARQVRARAAVLHAAAAAAADIVVAPPVVDPRLSTRERFAQHTADAFCAGCHLLMDPIGFAFEHYDAAGRWRDIDAGKPVDATGSLTGTDVDGALDGVPQPGRASLADERRRSRAARPRNGSATRSGAAEQTPRRPVHDRPAGRTRSGRERAATSSRWCAPTVQHGRVPQPPAGGLTMNRDELSRGERSCAAPAARRSRCPGSRRWRRAARTPAAASAEALHRDVLAQRHASPARGRRPGTRDRLHAVADPVAAGSRTRTTSSSIQGL